MRLTEEQTLIRDTARAFAREQLAPRAAAWDREARFPKEAVAEMGHDEYQRDVIRASAREAKDDAFEDVQVPPYGDHKEGIGVCSTREATGSFSEGPSRAG